MISRIRGKILDRNPEWVEVLTDGGLVYEVHVPLTVFQRLPEKGEFVELRTVLIPKDDVQNLYGFLNAHERTLFGRLLTVQKVGARVALAMMSTYSASRLAQALAEKDVQALTQISGVGKKTAERAVLELGDKVHDLVAAIDPGGPETSMVRDAVAALVRLGYAYEDALVSVRELAGRDAPRNTEALIRRVLERRTARPE